MVVLRFAERRGNTSQSRNACPPPTCHPSTNHHLPSKLPHCDLKYPFKDNALAVNLIYHTRAATRGKLSALDHLLASGLGFLSSEAKVFSLASSRCWRVFRLDGGGGGGSRALFQGKGRVRLETPDKVRAVPCNKQILANDHSSQCSAATLGFQVESPQCNDSRALDLIDLPLHPAPLVNQALVPTLQLGNRVREPLGLTRQPGVILQGEAGRRLNANRSTRMVGPILVGREIGMKRPWDENPTHDLQLGLVCAEPLHVRGNAGDEFSGQRPRGPGLAHLREGGR